MTSSPGALFLNVAATFVFEATDTVEAFLFAFIIVAEAEYLTAKS